MVTGDKDIAESVNVNSDPLIINRRNRYRLHPFKVATYIEFE